jgi:hypothetical protein
VTRWEETKKTTPSRLQEAIMHRVSVNVHSQQEMYCVNTFISIVLIVLLFQENKSFGASTICIHPLMYVKPCRDLFHKSYYCIVCTINLAPTSVSTFLFHTVEEIYLERFQ